MGSGAERRRAPDLVQGGVRWWLAPGVAREDAASLLEKALAALAEGAANRKRGRRKELYRLALSDGAGEYLLKVNRYDRGTAFALRRWRASKARGELDRAVTLAARGVPTPLPLAAGERRRGGRLDACFLLVRVLDGAVDLRRLWLESPVSPAGRRAEVRALGALARRAHDAGLVQEDFAPNNVLAHGAALLLIDFERARLRRRVSRRARRRMLAKLDRHLFGAPVAARMRFLLAYTEGDRARARRWWRELVRARQRLMRRDRRHLRRVMTTPGRRFAPITLEGWHGFARRETPEERLREAIAASADPSKAGRFRIETRPELWVWWAEGISARQGRALWVAAELLWRRAGLGPRPLALLHRDGAVRLVFARERATGDAASLETLDSDAGARAATVLLRRLRSLGHMARLPAPEALGVRDDPSPWEARGFLLDPSLLTRLRRGGRGGLGSRPR